MEGFIFFDPLIPESKKASKWSKYELYSPGCMHLDISSISFQLPLTWSQFGPFILVSFMLR